MIIRRGDRGGRETKQCRRFAAADLRPHGAAHQPEKSCLGRDIEQDLASPHRPSTARADDGERNRLGARPRIAARDLRAIHVHVCDVHATPLSLRHPAATATARPQA